MYSWFLPSLLLHIFLVHQNQSTIHNIMKESIIQGSTYPGRYSNTTFRCLRCLLLLCLLLLLSLLIIMIFRHIYFFCDLIKHCGFFIFFFLFLSLHLILIQDLFIEYDISDPNDFFFFHNHINDNQNHLHHIQ